jgi:phosphoglycolate phosphatase-like HAD superfamily hydrolase
VIRLILFDVDGTLIHTGGAGVKAFARTLASEFSRHNGTEKVRFGGRTDSSLVRELFHHCQIDYHPSNVRRFFDSYVFWLQQLLAESARGGPCPGVVSLIQRLLALPQPPIVGLLTGNIRLGAEIKLRHYSLWEPFQTGAFGDEHEDRNQIAVIARRRADQLLGRPLADDEIVVIGDTPCDIECGRAIRARVLAVASGGAPLAELEAQCPDWVLTSLEGVCASTLCNAQPGAPLF